MKWYGSVNNRLAENARNPKPEIGMGVTEYLWSDRHAYEIIAIKDDRHITIRRMGCRCIDYFAGDWEVFSDPTQQQVKNLFLTKKGQWRERYGNRRLGSTIFGLGVAREYEDPSF